MCFEFSFVLAWIFPPMYRLQPTRCTCHTAMHLLMLLAAWHADISHVRCELNVDIFVMCTQNSEASKDFRRSWVGHCALSEDCAMPILTRRFFFLASVVKALVATHGCISSRALMDERGAAGSPCARHSRSDLYRHSSGQLYLERHTPAK